MSLRELATLAGISPTGLHYIEGGKRNPTLDTLVALKRACGVPWAIILRGIE